MSTEVNVRQIGVVKCISLLHVYYSTACQGVYEKSVKKVRRGYRIHFAPPDSVTLFRITDPLDQAQPPEAPGNSVGEEQLDHGHGGSEDDCLNHGIVEDCDIQHAIRFGKEKDAVPGKASKPQGDSQSAHCVEQSFCLHHPHELFLRHSDGLDHAQLMFPSVDTVDHCVDQVHNTDSAQDDKEGISGKTYDRHRALPGTETFLIAVRTQIGI